MVYFRYYGLFKTGELKIRGIELRQRNTPPLIKEIQQDMLTAFSHCYTAQEFLDKIPESITKTMHHAGRIISGTVDPAKFVITTHVSKDITDYKVNTCAKAALLQLRDNNISISAGQSLYYIVTNEHSNNYRDRVCITDAITNDTTIDTHYYLRQIAQCAESILIPFGFDKETFEKMFNCLKNKEEKDVSVLSRVRTHQTCL